MCNGDNFSLFTSSLFIGPSVNRMYTHSWITAISKRASQKLQLHICRLHHRGRPPFLSFLFSCTFPSHPYPTLSEASSLSPSHGQIYIRPRGSCLFCSAAILWMGTSSCGCRLQATSRGCRSACFSPSSCHVSPSSSLSSPPERPCLHMIHAYSSHFIISLSCPLFLCIRCATIAYRSASTHLLAQPAPVPLSALNLSASLTTSYGQQTTPTAAELQQVARTPSSRAFAVHNRFHGQSAALLTRHLAALFRRRWVKHATGHRSLMRS